MGLDRFNLVLLVSEREGWVFSKSEVNQNIAAGRWKLSSGDYKINWPLATANGFASLEKFRSKLG